MRYPYLIRTIFIPFSDYFPFDVSSRNCVLAMVFSYSFDSAIRLTLDEAQGKAQEYVLFVSTIASLLEHCASTPFRRFVANTLPPTPGPFTNTHAPGLLYTHEILFSPVSSSPSSPFSSSTSSSPATLSLSFPISISYVRIMPIIAQERSVSHIIDINYSPRSVHNNFSISFWQEYLSSFAPDFFFR